MRERENMPVPVTAHSEKSVPVVDDNYDDVIIEGEYDEITGENEVDKAMVPVEEGNSDVVTGGGESVESEVTTTNKQLVATVEKLTRELEQLKNKNVESEAEVRQIEHKPEKSETKQIEYKPEKLEKVTTLEQLNEARQKYAEEIAKSRSMKSRAKKLVAKLGIKRFDQSNDDEVLLVESAKINYGKTLEDYKKAVKEKINDAENIEDQKNILLENTEILAKEGIQLDEDIVNKRAERLGMLGKFGEKLHGVTKWWNGLGKKGWIKGKIPRMLIGGGAVALAGVGIKGLFAGAAGMGTYDALKTEHDEADEKKVQSSFDSLMKEKGISADDSEFIEMMKTEVLEKYDLKTVESERVRKEKERRNRVIAGATVFAGTLAWGKLFSDYGGNIKDYVGEKVGVAKDFYGDILSGDEVTGNGVSQGVEVVDVTHVGENLPLDDNLANEEAIAPEIHEVKVNVEKGDNLWKIIEDKLDGSGKFKGMNEAQKIHFIDDLKDDFANMSGAQRTEIGFKRPDDIGFIVPNQELDLSSVLGNDSIIEQARVDALGLSEGQISSIEDNLAGGTGNVPSENSIIQPRFVMENTPESPIGDMPEMENITNENQIVNDGLFGGRGLTFSEVSVAENIGLAPNEYDYLKEFKIGDLRDGLSSNKTENPFGSAEFIKIVNETYNKDMNPFKIGFSDLNKMGVKDFINTYLTPKG
ncbi:MAG: hypothetical protein KAT32_04125 [Candidatus Moranbacteria bacterium]|nr:hypothetical protein [Candidatus Moranbacteria bacterium]